MSRDDDWSKTTFAAIHREANKLARLDAVKQARGDGTYEVVTRDELRRRHTAKTGTPTMTYKERQAIRDLWVDFGKHRHWHVGERVA